MVSKGEQLRRLVVEAERNSLANMWKVRNHQPTPERITKVVLGAALKQPSIQVCAKKMIAVAQGYGGSEYI